MKREKMKWKKRGKVKGYYFNNENYTINENLVVKVMKIIFAGNQLIWNEN